jgi:hypothetical protein
VRPHIHADHVSVSVTDVCFQMLWLHDVKIMPIPMSKAVYGFLAGVSSIPCIQAPGRCLAGGPGRRRFRYSQVDSIFLKTPIKVPFSRAAATRSLSPSCLFTASSVLWVPFFMRTSTRNRGGRACSSLVRTPRPMTVASEQCVMVGVISTKTVLMRE